MLSVASHWPLQVVLAPLFVVRNHLPVALLMNIETPRLKSSSHVVEVAGQGRAQQLLSMAGDVTHNITFKLRSVTVKLRSVTVKLRSVRVKPKSVRVKLRSVRGQTEVSLGQTEVSQGSN